MKFLMILVTMLSSLSLFAAQTDLEGKWYTCNRQDEKEVLAQYFLIEDNVLTYSVFEHTKDDCSDVGKQRGVINSKFQITSSNELKACENSQEESTCQNMIFNLENDALTMEMNSENIVIFFGEFKRLD